MNPIAGLLVAQQHAARPFFESVLTSGNPLTVENLRPPSPYRQSGQRHPPSAFPLQTMVYKRVPHPMGREIQRLVVVVLQCSDLVQFAELIAP